MVYIPYLYSNPSENNKNDVAISLIANTNLKKVKPVDEFDDFPYIPLNSSGFYIAGICNIYNKFKGCEIAGIFNMNKELEGLAVGGLMNYADTNKKLAIQIGLVNIIDEYDPNGTVIQIGIDNRIGDKHRYFLNVIRKKKGLEKKL